MAFTPRTPPSLETLDDVRKWVGDELRNIALEETGRQVVRLNPIHRAIEKPRDGMLIYADGTDYDPGSGVGGYVYENGVWVKFGSAPGQVKGTSTNDNAQAGNVGEWFQTTSGLVAVVSNVHTPIAAGALSAGDWDVSGLMDFSSGAATTVFGGNMGFSLTPAAAATNESIFIPSPAAGLLGLSGSVTIQPTRFSLAALTTVYLNGLVVWSGGTGTSLLGVISARRMR